ncbi:hypothetical protein NECAME_04298 [Necator americanus]|uniref:Beta'-coat protein n=1 Tax=Necator americanus TaxID=51031 RepID=W2SUL1_NECAM|nr:hypothetical protein NECAME_04298 [Necator americanus]ETN73300.1 hypothetical protein NECAME_04298 [Necator americanus]
MPNTSSLFLRFKIKRTVRGLREEGETLEAFIVSKNERYSEHLAFLVCDLPVRAAKFIPRKSWVVTGSDDMHVRVFNYNTLERVHQFEAHSDYLRSIVVHPTQSFIITSSDDMMIKLWDWDNKWQMKQSFEGHTHYVMQVAINPKDNNTFATASLDKTVKVWQFGSQHPNFTLEGHDKGVNCVDYYHGGDKPYLISGADDHLVKIWDYQNKTCVQTLDGHAQNVSSVCFHPELPLIITGSEDSTVRLWHSSTYRLETTLNYGLERVWCIQAQRGSNTVAIGYDEGSVTLKLGREEPAVSMDQSGKILWARHSEIQQANLKTLDVEASEAIQDGERLPLSVKDLGACEIYPQTLAHSSNGRFVVACGDGEYIVYTAMALRNKDFGQDFKQIRVDVVMEGIDGGPLLAARSATSLCFYDWETAQMVRRIEIAAKHVYWSDNGEMVAICGDDSFYVLKYNPDAFVNASPEEITEDGVEDTFEVIGEQAEGVKTAFWIGDCFVFTTSLNRLNYYVGGEIVTIAHMDRPLYLLGYMAKESRVYAVDKELNVVSYKLLLCVLEYQTAVMRRDFETADKVLSTIPKEQRTRVAHFLEKQGFKRQALAVSQDPDHRFDLALALGDLKTAYDLALQGDSEEKWKMLSQAATLKSELMLAGECLGRARDYGGLLLLATCAGSAPLLHKLAADSATNGHHNVHFTTSLLLGDVDACIESLIATDRIPEAAFFARTHCPSQLQRIMGLWKEKANRVQKNTTRKIGESLADPGRYENLFPEWATSQRAESYLRELSKLAVPASVRAPTNVQRNVTEELETAMSTGAVTFDELGHAHLRGAPRKTTPSMNSTEPKLSPTPAVVVAAGAAAPVLAEIARERTPSPPRMKPTPEPEQENENGRQLSDDDSDGLSREAIAGAAASTEPDVVSERPRPDVVPRHGGPDLLTSAAPQRPPQPEVVVDAGEVRWSDDDFGDVEDGGNDINLDDLNLDDED